MGGKSMQADTTVLPDLDLYFCKFFFNMVKCTPLHIADGCKNWYYFFFFFLVLLLWKETGNTFQEPKTLFIFCDLIIATAGILPRKGRETGSYIH